MRLSLLAFLLLVSLPLAAQPTQPSGYVDLHLQALMVPADSETLPSLPALLVGDGALRHLELTPSGNSYRLNARLVFATVAEYEAWREAETTLRMMESLRRGPERVRIGLSVGRVALAARAND